MIDNRRARDTSYDAFVSYSAQADGALAPHLARRIERIATPWYRRRRLRVFCDKHVLGAGPLREPLRAAVRSSRFVILLASPQAATSRWVQEELEILANSDDDALTRLLIAPTAGTIEWHPASGSFVGDNLPPILRQPGVLDEPRFVDLRRLGPARSRARRALLADVAAELAAPILGVTKDEIRGQELTSRRRSIGAIVAAVTVLSLVAGLAVVGFRRAGEQQRLADARARQSQSRALAAAASASPYLDQRTLLAAAAVRAAPTDEATAAVLELVNQHPEAVTERQVPEDGRLMGAAFVTPDRVDVYDAEGRVTSYPAREATSAAVSNGGVLAVSDADGVRVRDAARTGPALAPGVGRGRLHFSADGTTLAVVGPDARVFDVASGRQLFPAVVPFPGREGCSEPLSALSPDNGVIVFAACGSLELWDLRSQTRIAERAVPNGSLTDAHICALDLAPDGRTAAIGLSAVPISLAGVVWLVDLHAAAPDFRPVGDDRGSVEALGFDRSGTTLGVVEVRPAGAAGRMTHLVAVDVRSRSTRPLGPPRPDRHGASIASTGDGRFVAHDGRSLSFWDLNRASRLGRTVFADLPLLRDRPVVFGLAATHDGSRLLVDTGTPAGADSNGIRIYRHTVALIDVTGGGLTQLGAYDDAGRSDFASHVTAFALSRTGRYAVVQVPGPDTGETAVLFDVAAGRRVMLRIPDATAATFSAAEDLAVIGRSDGTALAVELPDATNMVPIRMPPATGALGSDEVTAVAVRPGNGRVVVADGHGQVLVFDRRTLGSQVVVRPEEGFLATGAAIDPSGSHVLVTSSHRGDVALYGGASRWRLDPARWLEPARRTGSVEGATGSARFLPSGRLVAASDFQHSVLLWDPGRDRPVAAPLLRLPDGGSVGGLAPGAGDHVLVIVNGSGTVLDVPTDLDDIVAVACQLAGRRLDPAEARAFSLAKTQLDPCRVGS